MTQPAHLFFYGVLQESVARWPFLEGLGQGSPATTRGLLYVIPSGSTWYPALIASEAGEAVTVHGAVHAASQVDIGPVDAFEGADYARQELPIERADGSGPNKADVYVWIAELPDGAERIEHGDFARWLKETGRKPYSGG
ncbi:MAG: gamma-glutamylcyclotransferase [Pseudomonadota bacterium]